MHQSDRKSLLTSTDTFVVKVGSRVLSDAEGRLDVQFISRLSEQLSAMVDGGKHVALVSSGAVAAGMGKLNLKRRPTDLAHLQAVASVGQAHLIQAYEKVFASHGRHAAQILLTADDLDDRKRYLNLRNTIVALLEMEAIPVINENDSVSVEELQTTFGDNDRLAAMVAALFERPALIILSDVHGVYDRNPQSTQGTADEQMPTILKTIVRVDQDVLKLAGNSTGGPGKGGMFSKLKAAQFATRSGAPVVIAGGRIDGVLQKIVAGEDVGTLFLPESRGLASKKRWIGFTAQTAGKIICDAGAARALRTNGPSLLAIGIVEIEGKFGKGDVVSVRDQNGEEVARGLTNYDAEELRKIKGLRSESIAEVLGHRPYEEVIHRDNMALI